MSTAGTLQCLFLEDDNQRSIGMTEKAAILDLLLSQWHEWCCHSKTVRGFSPVSAGFDQYRTSRQYDDTNGALDDALDGNTMKVMDFQIWQMEADHRHAIQHEANRLSRNLPPGADVFISPRLPKDRRIRHSLILEAKSFLTKRLHNAGVL